MTLDLAKINTQNEYLEIFLNIALGKNKFAILLLKKKNKFFLKNKSY